MSSKQVISKKSTTLEERKTVEIDKQRKTQLTQWKKELRLGVKLGIFGIYSLILFLVGGTYFEKNSAGKSERDFVSQVEMLRQELQGIQARSPRSSDMLIRENNHVLEQSIVEAIKQTSEYRDEIIGRQQREIADLKRIVRDQMERRPVRGIASVKGKTLPYSQQNYDVVYYEHRLRVKRFEEEQNKQLSAYIKSLNMQDSVDVGKLEAFKDRQKIELYSFRKELESQRTKFRNDKFIVLK